MRGSSSSTSGREIILRDIHEGEYFGEYSAIDGKPRSAAIRAIVDTVVARMSAAVFLGGDPPPPRRLREVLKTLWPGSARSTTHQRTRVWTCAAASARTPSAFADDIRRARRHLAAADARRARRAHQHASRGRNEISERAPARAGCAHARRNRFDGRGRLRSIVAEEA